MATVPSNLNFPTSKQVPDQAIMQLFGKASYLGNQFSLPIAGFSITGTSETNVILINVPTTASISIFMSLRRCSAVAQAAQFKFYFNPTVTAGTTVTPVNARFANSNTSQSVCSTAPTGSTKGTLTSTLECPTADYSTIDDDLLLILDPGVSMLVTCIPTGTTVVNLNMTWWEL